MRDVDRSSEDGALQLDASTNPQEAREIEAVVSLLRSLPDPEPHSDLTARVMAQVTEIEIRARDRQRLRWIPRSGFATALAASLAVVAVGMWVRQVQSPAPETELASAPRVIQWRVTEPSRSGAAGGVAIASAYPGARRPAFFIRNGPEPTLQGGPRMAANPVSLFDQHLDAQLNELQLDPQAFFLRLERVQDRERFIQRLAERAARRGDAAQVGLSVRTVPHRLAPPMVEQFLQASLVQQVSARR